MTIDLLAYWPSSPVSSRLSSWRMNVPGFANSGMKRVTSLRWVQIIPSPRVGSGVDVRQTAGCVGEVRSCLLFTMYAERSKCTYTRHFGR